MFVPGDRTDASLFSYKSLSYVCSPSRKGYMNCEGQQGPSVAFKSRQNHNADADWGQNDRDVESCSKGLCNTSGVQPLSSTSQLARRHAAFVRILGSALVYSTIFFPSWACCSSCKKRMNQRPESKNVQREMASCQSGPRDRTFAFIISLNL
jgi:hypothetical protein